MSSVRLLLQRRQRRLFSRLLACGILLTSAACGADTAAPTPESGVNIRVINGLFEGDTSASTPVSIDFLIDSSATAPSAYGIPVAGISTGEGENRYATFSRGIYNFVARRSGDTTEMAQVYTGPDSKPYLPKLFLSAGFFYTAVVAGVVPESGAIAENSIPFILFADDLYPGPQNLADVTQARFHVINAAPYTSPDGLGKDAAVYVTPGATAPDTITNYVATRTSFYRYGTEYINVNPGVYTITLRASGAIVAQQAITFAAGEVRTLILQSTAAGPPSLANHKLTNILDRKY